MKARRVLVVGLGQFGSSIVETLWESGAEVIAVDEHPDAVEAVKDRTSAAFVGDATSPKVLESIGAREVDTAVVTFGEQFEPAVLCVATLVQFGVKDIIARAATDRQSDILRAVGARRVLQLEAEMGRRVGAEITMPLAQDLMDLASQFRVVPWDAHGPLIGQTLASAKLRQRFRLNVLGVRQKGTAQSARTKIQQPNPDYIIGEGDTLLLVGEARDVNRFISDIGG